MDIKQLEATPKKKLYYSIIADYDLKKGLSELIDNAIDNWKKNKFGKKLLISINFDPIESTIIIKDNSGGVSEENLENLEENRLRFNWKTRYRITDRISFGINGNVMQHKNIGDVMLIIVRYFGGIKLGAGGLVRAYSHATQQAYDQAPIALKIQLEKLSITCDFSDEQSLRHWLGLHDGKVMNTTYSQQVNMSIAVEQKHLQPLKIYVAALKNADLKECSTE